MKYKVGDKVRVKKDLKGGVFYGGQYFCYGMKEFCGKEFVITQISSPAKIELGDITEWWFSEKMLEPVKNSKIVITTDGKETLARLYDGNEVVRSAKAICSDDDEFDFSKGAEIAFNRLTGKKNEIEEEPKFNVGDLVVKTDDFGLTRCYPKKNTVGKIMKIIIDDNCFLIQWERGSTSDGDCWSISANHLRKIEI